MNYLAHLHLGGPAPHQLLGSLYGDFVKGSLEGRFPPALEAAIRLHRHIDSYTAQHPLVLAALESVGAVTVFPEKRAENFLRLAKPDVYIKGGDYTPETLDADERAAVESGGGEVVIIPFVPGTSTTERMNE